MGVCAVGCIGKLTVKAVPAFPDWFVKRLVPPPLHTPRVHTAGLGAARLRPPGPPAPPRPVHHALLRLGRHAAPPAGHSLPHPPPPEQVGVPVLEDA